MLHVGGRELDPADLPDEGEERQSTYQGHDRRSEEHRGERKPVDDLVALSACSALVPVVSTNFAAVLLISSAIFGLNWKSCTQLAIFTDVFPESTLARLGGITGMAEGLVTIALTLGTGPLGRRNAARQPKCIRIHTTRGGAKTEPANVPESKTASANARGCAGKLPPITLIPAE